MRTLILILTILILGCKKEEIKPMPPKDPDPVEQHYLEGPWRATANILGTATDSLFTEYFEITMLTDSVAFYQPVLSDHATDTLYLATDSLWITDSPTRMLKYSLDTLRITDVYGANMFTMNYVKN